MFTKEQAILRAKHVLWHIDGLDKQAEGECVETTFSDGGDYDSTPCYKVSIPSVYETSGVHSVCIDKETGATLGAPFEED